MLVGQKNQSWFQFHWSDKGVILELLAASWTSLVEPKSCSLFPIYISKDINWNQKSLNEFVLKATTKNNETGLLKVEAHQDQNLGLKFAILK